MVSSRSKRLFIAAILAAATLAVLSVLNPWVDRLLFPRDYEVIDSIRTGMTERDVRARLGEPFREHTGKSEDYYVEGYGFKRRTITGKVLIYKIGAEHIAYVYIDERGRTEEVFVAGS